MAAKRQGGIYATIQVPDVDGALMLVVLVAAGCVGRSWHWGCSSSAGRSSGSSDRSSGSSDRIQQPSGGNGDLVEGWGGGYGVVPPELCPPVEDDAEIDQRVRQPFFQEGPA